MGEQAPGVGVGQEIQPAAVHGVARADIFVPTD